MKLRNLCRDQNGAILVEAAIVVPLLLALTFGAVQVGLMLWTQVGLQHGVEMAARCASVSDIAQAQGGLNPATSPTPCYTVNGTVSDNATKVKSYAASNSWGVHPPASVFDVGTCTIQTGSPDSTGDLVTASYPFTAINYLFSITLTARSCFPNTH
jgi:Flp pilus assembly protein TadG